MRSSSTIVTGSAGRPRSPAVQNNAPRSVLPDSCTGDVGVARRRRGAPTKRRARLDLVHDAEARRRRASRPATAAPPRPTRSTTRARRPRAASRRSGRRRGSRAAGRTRRSRGPPSRTRCRPPSAHVCSTHVLRDLVDRHRDVAARRDPDPLPRARIAQRRRDRVAHARRDVDGEPLDLSDRGVPGSRADERPFVELGVALGQAAHRELRGALVARCDEPVAQRLVVEQRPERVAQRADVARRYEERRRGRPGRRSRTPRSPTRRSAVLAAIASSSTTPNDSPRNDGAQNTVAPRRRALRSASVTRAEPLDVAIVVRARSSSALRAGADHPQLGVAIDAGPRVEQHRQSLARFEPAEEQHRGPRRRRGLRRRDAARSRCRSTARRTRRRSSCVSRSRAPISETATRNVRRIITDRSAGRSHWCGTSPDAWNVPTIGPVEPDERAEATGPAPAARAGARRRAPGCAAPRPCGARSPVPVAIGAIEPFDSHSTVGPTLTIDGSGGGPSHGADDPHVDVELAQLAREPEHLSLHAAGTRHGVRAHHCDSHAATACVWISSRVKTSRFAVARPVRLEQVPLCGARRGSAPRTPSRAPA